MSETRIPPQYLEGERAVLGGLLLENAALAKVMNALSPGDFYRQAHREIYAAMQELYRRNEPVDWMTLSAILKDQALLESVGGHGYLAELSAAVPSAANIMHYVKIVKDKAILRQILYATDAIREKCWGDSANIPEVLEDLQKVAFDSVEMGRPNQGPVHIKDALRKRVSKLEAETKSGIMSGLGNLDKITMGFRDSELTIVAARPSMGKTALLVDTIDAAIRQTPVLLFPLEMGEDQTVDRFLARAAGINLQHFRSRSRLAEYEWSRIITATGPLSECPLFIDSWPHVTVSYIRARAREIEVKTGLKIGLIAIDYLQLMEAEGRYASAGLNEKTGSISRGLKLLARELDVPVICLSQLSRKVEERPFVTVSKSRNKKDDGQGEGTEKEIHGRIPMLSDLRNSGDIEQDADVIIFIYRPGYYSADPKYKGKASAIVAKQRNGPVGIADLTWLEEICTFKDRVPESLANMEEM
jgi:replicative DNA helicase